MQPETLTYVLLHNFRSLNFKKMSELQTIALDHDIILLTESWLNNNTVKLSSMENFILHTCHRSMRKDGGVAVYIQDNLLVTIAFGLR